MIGIKEEENETWRVIIIYILRHITKIHQQ